MIKKSILFMVTCFILFSLGSFMASASGLEGEALKKELVEQFWESLIQSYEIYEFKADGTGYVYSADPIGAYDREALNEILKYIRHQSGTFFRYEVNGNTVTVTRDDFQNPVSLSYVTKKDDIDWDLGIMDSLPAHDSFFYEVDYQTDVNTDEPTNAVYFAKTYVSTGNTYQIPSVDSSTLKPVETPAPPVETVPVPTATLIPTSPAVPTQEAESFGFLSDMITQIQSVFDHVIEWISSFTDAFIAIFVFK